MSGKVPPVFGAIVVLALVAGCGAESVPPTDCIELAGSKLADLESGLNGGLTIRDVRGVKSGAHENSFFVSAEIDGPGLEGNGHIGTWLLTGALDGPGLIMAVPSVATEFSGFGDASKTDAEATMSDPGAQESRTCVKTAQGVSG